jgi:hypothetical protein
MVENAVVALSQSEAIGSEPRSPRLAIEPAVIGLFQPSLALSKSNRPIGIGRHRMSVVQDLKSVAYSMYGFH